MLEGIVFDEIKLEFGSRETSQQVQFQVQPSCGFQVAI